MHILDSKWKHEKTGGKRKHSFNITYNKTGDIVKYYYI